MRTKSITHRWSTEAGPRLEGSHLLDSAKVQAPCIVRNPVGGYRLFYTAVGPGKPYPICQGYILSAVSDDGLVFRKESGIRLAPQLSLPHISLRIVAPTVTRCDNGQWRMYFEARGPANNPPVICSAISSDMLCWKLEDGIRLQTPGGVGGPRYVTLPDGGGRLYCCGSNLDGRGEHLSKGVISAITADGLQFELEPGYRMRDKQADYDSLGITAAEVVPPAIYGGQWTMVFSAWQDVPPGTIVPIHPSQHTNSLESGIREDFAAASIAVDIAGYRSRIFVAHSPDGLTWNRGECAIDGGGYSADSLDAVHAEDMSVIDIGDHTYRMYYAACDKQGNWRIASAVTVDTEK